jgi:hypothetical protein
MRYGCQVSTTCSMTIISFSYVDLPKLWSRYCLPVNAKGHPSCINATLRPLLEASHSKTKVLVKCGTNKTRVVHMESFKVEKECLMISFQTKAFFLSSDVKGDFFFHKFS